MSNSTDVFLMEDCITVFGRKNKLVVGFPSHSYLINQVLLVAINCLLIVPTIALNGVSVTAIMKSTRLKSKPCYFLVVMQSLVDSIVGAIGIPLLVFVIVSPMLGIRSCSVRFIVFRTFFIPSGISILTLSAMTMERYIGVLHPYAYQTRVTKKGILIYECCGSCVIVLVVAVSLFVQRIITVFVTLLLAVFIVLNTVVYTRIYCVIAKIARTDRDQAVSLSEETLSKRQKYLAERKQAKSFFLVFICFILCFLPMAVAEALAKAFKISLFDKYVYQMWSMSLIMLNSILNSVIFFWTKKSLRREAIQVLRRSRVVS